jgi:hypothetical protein
MASTPEGRRLTEQHRQAQAQNRAAFLAQFVALWALLDSTRLDDTGPGWIQAVLRLIRPFRQQSAELATGYFVEFRQVEAPRIVVPRLEVPQLERPEPAPTPRRASTPAPTRRPTPTPTPRASQPARSEVRFEFDESAFTPREERRTRIEIPDIDWSPSDRAAQVSLAVTGPVGQKSKAARGKPLDRARDESFVDAAGAASRHVLTGGRQSLLTLLDRDPQSVGWIRVTDGDPCAFCAMLASRGIVFSRGSFKRSNAKFDGPGTVKVHDNCACTIEPVYSKNTQWPGRAREFRKMWDDHIKDNYSGENAIRAFRRLYEQQQRDTRRGQVA